MKIRKARLEDSPGLARVQVDSYRSAYAGILPERYLDRFTYEEQEQDWRDLLSQRTDDMLLVGEGDYGEIIGYALARLGPSEIPPYDAELVGLHVGRPYQRTGFGQELIAAIAERLKRLGATSLMLWTLEENSARELYEGLGGRVVGKKEWGGNGEYGTQASEVAYGWPSIEMLTAAGKRVARLPARIPARSPVFWASLVSVFVVVMALSMLKDWWLTGDEPNPLFYAIVPPISILGGSLSAYAVAKPSGQRLGLLEILAVTLGVNTVMQVWEIILKLVYYLLWQYPGILYMIIVIPLGFGLMAYALARWGRAGWLSGVILALAEFAGETVVGVIVTDLFGLTTPGS